MGAIKSWWWGIAIAVSMAGCASPSPTYDVRDPDPTVKIPAIKIAVQEKDLDHVRQMVKDLDSDDSAVRFFAIEGLRRLSGETYGYQYYEDAAERAPAIKKWKQWLADHDPHAAASQPVTSPDPATS